MKRTRGGRVYNIPEISIALGRITFLEHGCRMPRCMVEYDDCEKHIVDQSRDWNETWDCQCICRALRKDLWADMRGLDDI